ncbi:hypothetical protein [Variovorax saccharolyticus]|uniref:hypothetical protein n=1 Tax=Variovorax saccharolyticus TaxID=3053516 RepID=UPI0025789B56|nr:MULTISPECIES: hypothetical protein [unclassified Variovorax]MDM0016661.1 hypothetical protein [Variovorax sp. J22R187]MDM0023213.1 hypothetical protein [Variovorax sp. J31P216]
MKHFTLDPHMTASVGGAFYPTGHTIVMFPDPKDASAVGHQLLEDGFSGDEIYLIPPQVVLQQITPTVREADSPLPSAGTDAATVRAYTKLAREGHTALLVKTKNEATANRLMEHVRTVPFSIAQRYRMLVIEDL